MSSLEPVVWRVTCAAADCDPDRFRPVSRPVELKGDRKTVVKELRRRGWRPCPTSRGTQTIHWWCPTHAQRGGVS